MLIKKKHSSTFYKNYFLLLFSTMSLILFVLSLLTISVLSFLDIRMTYETYFRAYPIYGFLIILCAVGRMMGMKFDKNGSSTLYE